MKVLSIVNTNLPENAFAELKKVLRNELGNHGIKLSDSPEAVLEFIIGEDAPKDGFEITESGSGFVLKADSVINCFAAAGHFLFRSRFDAETGISPLAVPVSFSMKKPVRGIYLATHFYNYHHNSPMEDEERYIAEQALRGFNSVMFCLAPQHYTSFTEPAALAMIERLKGQIRFSKIIGMSTAFVGFTNTSFSNYKKEFEAQLEPDDSGRYVRRITAEFITEVCPSTEGGMKEIDRLQREFLSAFADCDIDYLYLWAYDEGGCLCEKCYPWSTNGFMKCNKLIIDLMKEYGMKTKPCISTWHFGVQMQNEWDNFYTHLESGEYSWAEYIMTCFQSGRIADVVRRKGVPDGVKFIDFPEISMQNPAHPWGGFGATPFPMYLDVCEKNCGQLMSGGYLYSEGIYEDVNKFIVAGFYTGEYENADEALKAYAAYEAGIYDEVLLCEFVRLCGLMEASHKRVTTYSADAPSTFVPRYATPMFEEYEIVKKLDAAADEKLRTLWKWRLFFIRASLDGILLEAWRDTGAFTLKNSEKAQELLKELNAISCVNEKTKRTVAPPLGV
ncbi:MAG: hypothetical protein MJ137_00845 [Clostridia bacterium]|nr:hypothetical protein [Clostridia bacterium]